MAPRPMRPFWFLLLLCFLFTLLSVTVFSAETPTTSARSAALYEPSRGTFLMTKNANLRMPMASTTKIMTALVALEDCDPSTVVTVPKEATGIEGSSLYLKEGEQMTLSDLLYGLLLRSANDAACAIAQAVAGSVEAFVERMNQKALALGLTDTHFDNPHGLDADTHYTTAEELARIAAAAMQIPTFCTMVKTISRRIGEGDSTRLVTNHNKLLRLYDGAIGVKTGFTKKSGRCLVSAAERDGVTLIAVTIHAPNDWQDHEAMLDFGFDTVECRTEAEIGQYRYTVPVLDGTASEVTVENTEPFSIVMKKTDSPIRCDVRLTRYTVAPIKKGDILGTLLFSQDGELLTQLPLRAMEDVNTVQKRRRFFFF
ncbi:MAG: D-alanyl-D-alanine carboxypeptidase [Clostridia bacterium]|nr:D-alanyl-D-alanine carboxypeptidase [Clostridia bacterium]